MCVQVLILLLLESRKFRNGMYKRLGHNHMSPFTIHILYIFRFNAFVMCAFAAISVVQTTF